MKKIHCALLAVLLLAACETASVEKYDAALQTWVGRPADVLISSWGIPDKTYRVNASTRLVAYIRGGIATYPGVAPTCTTAFTTGYATTSCLGGFPPEVQSLRCETTFTIVNDRITAWKHRGNDCRS